MPEEENVSKKARRLSLIRRSSATDWNKQISLSLISLSAVCKIAGSGYKGLYRKLKLDIHIGTYACLRVHLHSLHFFGCGKHCSLCENKYIKYE